MNLLALCCTLFAASPEAPPQFELATTRERPLVGSISRMTESELTLIGQPPLAQSELVSLLRLAEPRPPWPTGTQVVLFNGDRLVGAPAKLVGGVLHFRAAAIRRDGTDDPDRAMRIPLSAIAMLWLRSTESLDRERHAAFFADERANDQVVLRNGDMIAGTLTALDAVQGDMQIDVGADHRRIALSKVVAIAMGTQLARVRKPAGAFGHLVLANGTRLTAAALSIKDDILHATSPYRDPLQIALADLVALDIYHGKAVYLSDLKPTQYRYQTYLGEKFGWMADRNLDGGELQLVTPIGRQTSDKGIAVHGECGISYSLDGNYSRFESIVGLDAQLGKRGSVELRVLVDGKERKLGDGKQLTQENGPWRVKIDLKGAKELTLIVNWGDGGNVDDHVNWCDARLIP